MKGFEMAVKTHCRDRVQSDGSCSPVAIHIQNQKHYEHRELDRGLLFFSKVSH